MMKNIKVLFTGLILLCCVSLGYAQGPGGVSDQLSVWLKADAGVSSIGTSWQDQSGNGRHYTTVTGPTVIASDAGANNLPAVEILSGGFNGPAGAALGTSWTLFSVHRLLASGSTGRLIDAHSGNYLLSGQEGYSGGLYLEGNPSEYNSGIATTTNTLINTLYCYSRDNATGNITVKVNGVLKKTFTSTNSATGVIWDLNQGANASFNGGTDSRIGEFIIYNKALNATEITNVETYLINKFCLSYRNTAGAASSSPNLCVNTTLTNITHTTTGATGIGTATGLPAGVTASWASNTITISGTPTASGTFNYSIPLTGGCGIVNATGTITVQTGASTWLPTNLGASLALWLDAADAASMTQSGGLVSQWNDKSGNNKHATQATSGNRPTYTASALNGKSVLTFDGNSDKMTIPALGLSNSAMVIMVFKATNAPHAVLSGSGNDTWDEYGGTSYAHHFRVGRLDNIGAPSPLSTNNILGYLANSTTPVYNRRLNGNASSTSNAAFTFSSNITEIGWNAPNNGYYLNGTISEIIVVNAYSVSDAEKLEGYLAEKWGLRANLPSGHTYKTASLSLLNSTASAASSTPTLCINTALTNITHTTTGATGIGTATGLPAGVTATWANNTITISGTPTATGTFSYSIPLTGGCGSVNATGTITIPTVNTVSAASSTPILCVNTALTNITHTTTNATGIGTATGLPAGVTAAWASNTITISGTPTAAGTFNYSIPLTGGCGSVNATGTITVNINTAGAASSTPTLCTNTPLTNITRTTTGATGIGTATGLPTGLTAAWASNTITISGTPTASGTFSYSIPLTGGCGSVNATGTITVRASGAWFPTDLGASLALWLDAADAASMTQSGGLVSQWNDKSGNARHATQATSGNRPAFTASGLNGKSVLTFDGSDDNMSINAPFTNNSGTALIVYKPNSDNQYCLFTGNNDSWTIWDGNNYSYESTFRSVRLEGATNLISTNAANIFMIEASSVLPSYKMFKDGSTIYSSAAAFTFQNNINLITGNRFLNGFVCEVILIDNVLTESNRLKLEGYLAEKWGLRANLPGGHTYKSIAPTNVTATTAGAASSTPSLCNGGALTPITHTTTGATGIGTATGLPSGVTASWASNTISISGTPTATGTFSYSIPLTGGCGTANATGTITVGGPINTVGVASSTPTVCAGTALTNITHTTTNATGIGTATGLPAGVTAAWASNTITVSGTPTAGGTFNYTIPLTGGCGTVNATGTITVTINSAGAASSTPTLNVNTALTNITHTTTGATGIGTAVGLPAGVTAAWASNTITISGTPTASGNYNYSIPLTGGCGTVNATGTITVAAFPGGVSSQLNVWLRADAGVSAIGTSWQDQSGNGRHYTTVGSPTVIASDAGGNNLPAVEITNGGGFNGPAGAAIGSSWTLFSMHRLLPSDADGRFICTQQCNCLLANYSTYSNSIYLNADPNVLTSGIATTANTQTKTLYCYSRDAATNNLTVRVNGVLLQTFANATNYANGVIWNLNQGQYNEFSNSRIGEFMIYNRALSGAEITNVETYLKNKFCLTGGVTMSVGLASSSPTVGLNTVITNITHATTNATGIGTATGLPAGVSVAWSNNTITISGTPTASGTFNYSIPLRGACGTVNATGTITVVTSNTAGVASSTPTLCINTALTNITHATTGATGIGTATGLPAGVSASWLSNTITISGTPTASGTFAYSIPLTGGFGGSVNATGTITVTAANTAGTASSTPTLCINTALTNITRTTTGATGISNSGVSGGNGLPAGVSATWAGNVITISGTPTASGTFAYSIPLTGGCGTVNATGTITVSPVTVGGSVSGTSTVCPGSNSGTLTLSGHTGSVVRWESSSASNFASPTIISSTATSYTYTNLSSVTYYRAVVQSGTCSSSNSSAATITLSEAVDGGRIEW